MEDFVPYELAKRLNEVGFNYDTKEVYEINVSLERYFEIPKPTTAQVLKWLRKNHNIFIVVFINDDADNPVTYEIYEGVECVLCVHRYFSLNDWSTAEIDAIEYVLDSLI